MTELQDLIKAMQDDMKLLSLNTSNVFDEKNALVLQTIQAMVQIILT